MTAALLLTNGISATLFALLLTLVARWIRRPEVRHLLWLAVLLELVAPPLLHLPLPGFPSLTATPVAAMTPGVASSEESAATPTSASGSDGWLSARRLAAVLWLGGVAALAAVSFRRATRFGRLIAAHGAGRPDLDNRVAAWSSVLGIRRPPRVLVVDAPVPPLLWAMGRRPTLVFPENLLAALPPDERDALMLHELAHLARKDHLVRWIESAIGILFWWCPSAWWARRELRRAEEQCCDDTALRHLPSGPRTYARALLHAVEQLGAPPPELVPAANGSGFRDLHRRLDMILCRPTPPRLSRTPLVLLATILAAVLLVGPVTGGVDEPSFVEDEPSPAGEEVLRAESLEHRGAIAALEREQRAVERELEALERRHRAEEGRARAETEQRRSEQERLRAERDRDRADEARFQAEELRRLAFERQLRERERTEQELERLTEQHRAEMAEAMTAHERLLAESAERTRLRLPERSTDARAELDPAVFELFTLEAETDRLEAEIGMRRESGAGVADHVVDAVRRLRERVRALEALVGSETTEMTPE